MISGLFYAPKSKYVYVSSVKDTIDYRIYHLQEEKKILFGTANEFVNIAKDSLAYKNFRCFSDLKGMTSYRIHMNL